MCVNLSKRGGVSARTIVRSCTGVSSVIGKVPGLRRHMATHHAPQIGQDLVSGGKESLDLGYLQDWFLGRG